MRTEYDFSKATRGTVSDTKGKTRITIYIDTDVLHEFRTRAEQVGTGYQTMMNEALRRFVSAPVEKPLTESSLRRIIREELPKFAPSKQRDAKERAA